MRISLSSCLDDSVKDIVFNILKQADIFRDYQFIHQPKNYIPAASILSDAHSEQREAVYKALRYNLTILDKDMPTNCISYISPVEMMAVIYYLRYVRMNFQDLDHITTLCSGIIGKYDAVLHIPPGIEREGEAHRHKKRIINTCLECANNHISTGNIYFLTGSGPKHLWETLNKLPAYFNAGYNLK